MYLLHDHLKPKMAIFAYTVSKFTPLEEETGPSKRCQEGVFWDQIQLDSLQNLKSFDFEIMKKTLVFLIDLLPTIEQHLARKS